MSQLKRGQMCTYIASICSAESIAAAVSHRRHVREARARRRWQPDRLAPRSPTTVSWPSGISLMKSCAPDSCAGRIEIGGSSASLTGLWSRQGLPSVAYSIGCRLATTAITGCGLAV